MEMNLHLLNPGKRFSIIKISVLILGLIGIAIIYYSLNQGMTKTPTQEKGQKKNSSRNFITAKQPPENVTSKLEDLQIVIPIKIDGVKEPDKVVNKSNKIKPVKAESSKKPDLTEENQTTTLGNNSGITSLPRQILEVLPEKDTKELTGTVRLKLRINETGKVTGHTILNSSLECEDCLKEIITAAYQSRWEPGMKDGTPCEYWVEKAYSFN